MTVEFQPRDEAEAAAIVRQCHADERTLAITGGGTRAGLGNPVVAESRLSTRGLSGISSYIPAEMTMSAGSGTPLSVIEAALAEAGQMLAFEPIDHRPLLGTQGEPTIGGMFSVNASGPRRLTAGAARDHLLGIRFVNGTGEIIKAGGRVMKNVTGLDLSRLLCGAHGTLGLLTEVSFKVLPVPPRVATILLSGLDDTEAATAMAAAMALSVEVSGAAHLPESVRSRFSDLKAFEGAATVLRLEGLDASVAVRIETLTKAMARFGSCSLLDHETTLRLWREIRDVRPFCDGTQRPVWRVSLAPSEGQRLVAALRLQTGVDAFYDWQSGLVWLRMEADAEADLVRRTVQALGGGHATLMRAPDAVRATTPAFEPEPPAVAALSQRIRLRLDPKGLFNPGRMG